MCSAAQLLILAGNAPTFGSQETCKKNAVKGHISPIVWILWHPCVYVCASWRFTHSGSLSKGRTSCQKLILKMVLMVMWAVFLYGPIVAQLSSAAPPRVLPSFSSLFRFYSLVKLICSCSGWTLISLLWKLTNQHKKSKLTRLATSWGRGQHRGVHKTKLNDSEETVDVLCCLHIGKGSA